MAYEAATSLDAGAAGAKRGPEGGNLDLVLTPPMPRQAILRVMLLGFGLTVLLVLAAAYFGYRGSLSIQDAAQDLVRENLVNTPRAAELETRIETDTEVLIRELVWLLGACFILALGGAALTIWITDRAFARLAWQAEELNRVSWHLVEGHEQIARRFSHEMHDELGQALTGLKAMVRRVRPEELAATRPELLELLDEVMRDVRELSQLLRPVILDDFGLDAGLRWLVERFTQRTNIQVDYQSNFSARTSEQVETQLFRIAQEALTNIARHSGATQAWIHLEQRGDGLTLTIEDNGKGLSDMKPTGPSLGMVGMRARVRQVQGELSVGARAEGGLRVRAAVPLADPTEHRRSTGNEL